MKIECDSCEQPDENGEHGVDKDNNVVKQFNSDAEPECDYNLGTRRPSNCSVIMSSNATNLIIIVMIIMVLRLVDLN